MAKKEILQVRRCHICGTVEEAVCVNSADRVLQCQLCAKKFAPFYFTPDRFVPTPDLGPDLTSKAQRPLEALGHMIKIKINPSQLDPAEAESDFTDPPQSRIRPLVGFTVWWSDEGSESALESVFNS